MKNLLACFANCRYNTRCEDLKNEIQDKTEQAAGDINQYLAEKSVPPIRIQLLTRGLKFVPLSKLEKPKPERKGKSSVSNKSNIIRSQPVKRKRSRKRIPMPKKTTQVESNNTSPNADGTHMEGLKEKTKMTRSTRSVSVSRVTKPARNSKKSGKGKLYIILENETATVVDEQGMIKRMLAGPSSKARFFEAKEVEAQLQIVYKK